MELDSLNIEQIIAQGQQIATEHPEWLAIGGGVVLVLLIIRAAVKNARRSRLKQYAPNLQIVSFQTSPLGKDGFLKVRNMGEPAILKSVVFKKRYDLSVKDKYRDSRVEKNKDYAFLIEVRGNHRIDNGFLLVLEYADEKGHRYRQVFDPAEQLAKKAKYIGKK